MITVNTIYYFFIINFYDFFRKENYFLDFQLLKTRKIKLLSKIFSLQISVGKTLLMTAKYAMS